MKTPKAEAHSSTTQRRISDAELTAALENSNWARMEREAREYAAAPKKPPLPEIGFALEINAQSEIPR